MRVVFSIERFTGGTKRIQLPRCTAGLNSKVLLLRWTGFRDTDSARSRRCNSSDNLLFSRHLWRGHFVFVFEFILRSSVHCLVIALLRRDRRRSALRSRSRLAWLGTNGRVN